MTSPSTMARQGRILSVATHRRLQVQLRVPAPAWNGGSGGALSQRKNIPLLLRVVASLLSRNKFQNYQLVLAGPELPVLHGGSEIHETIRELGLRDVVVLTGHVTDERLPGLYAQAKLLVMPSLYEGFGLPVLESRAVGTPVVASNCSSIPEVAGVAAHTRSTPR